MERDTLTRLTSTPASDRKPVWTPDGQRVTFTSTRADRSTPNLYWQRADGTGEVQRLTQSKNPQLPSSWHPDGRVLAFEEQNPQTGYDVMLLPMEGDFKSGWKPGKPTAFLNSGFAEREPMFAPNGRWLAYSSNESGRDEVYVRPFPGPGSKWQISTGGGLESYVVPDKTRAAVPSGRRHGRQRCRGGRLISSRKTTTLAERPLCAAWFKPHV